MIGSSLLGVPFTNLDHAYSVAVPYWVLRRGGDIQEGDGFFLSLDRGGGQGGHLQKEEGGRTE